MTTTITTTPSGEHPLNTGFTLYLMRRQKHTRKGAAAAAAQAQQQAAAAVAAATKKDGDDSEQTPAPSAVAPPPAVPVENTVEDYEKAIKKIASFNTVEGFWRVYSHIYRPNEVAHSTDLHMFREGIKPVWEDPANKRGGKLVVKVKKGLGARYWESLLIAVIGEQFGDLASEVCGVVISVRHNEDVLSLWTRNSDNTEGLHRMREILKKSLRLPGFVPIDYKRHDTAESAAAAAGQGPTPAAGSAATTTTTGPSQSGGGRGQSAWRTRPLPAATGGGAGAGYQPSDWRS